MTVNSSNSSVSYSGDGSTVAFPVPFYFLDVDHISVSFVDDTTGESSPIGSGAYAVVGAGNQSGGTLTFVAVPGTGLTVVIARIVPISQQISYAPNDKFPAKVNEGGLDKLTMIDQQQQRGIDVSIKFPETESAIGTTLPAAADRANKVIAFGPDGSPTVMVPVSGSAIDVLVQLAQPGGSSQVGFRQAGGAAILRNAQDKARERKSWNDYVSDLTGATDQTAGVIAALAWVSANGHELVGEPTDRILFSSPLIVPFPAQIDMRGGRLVAAPSLTAGVAVTMKNLNVSGATNAVEHRRMNICVQGVYGGEAISKPPNLPAASYNQLDGILIDGSLNQITDVDLDIWVEGFRDGLVNGGTNTYLHRMNRIHIKKCWRRGYSILPGTESGENLSINGGVIANCVNGDGTAVGIYGVGLQQTSLYCKSLSLDYCDSLYYWNGTDGQLLFDSCHFENGNNNPMGVLDTASAYAQVSMINCTQVFGGVTGYLPAEPTDGRPVLHLSKSPGNGFGRITGGQIQCYGRGNTEIYQNQSGIPVMVESVLVPVQTHQPPLISASLNRLRNSNFATGDFTGWTQNVSTGQTFTIDPVGDGTFRFKVVGTNAAGSGGISQFIAVRPGQRAIVRAFVQTSGVTNGTANLNFRFFDQAGNQISTTTVDGIGSGAAAETLLGGAIVIPDGVSLLRTDLAANILVGTAWFRKATTCVI